MSFQTPRMTIGNITLWDLNPNDIAIKNDFQDNLLSLAADLMSIIRGWHPTVKVLQGMSSLSKLKSKTKTPTYLEKRYCSANALCITWDKFDKEAIKDALRKVLGLFENKLSFLIHDDKLEAYRTDRREIKEIVDEEVRTFYVLEDE